MKALIDLMRVVLPAYPKLRYSTNPYRAPARKSRDEGKFAILNKFVMGSQKEGEVLRRT